MPVALTAVISATTRWLLRAYPPSGGALGLALAHPQVRQAATVAAWLRYPTALDAELLALLGPGGSARLDWTVGADPAAEAPWPGSQVPLDDSSPASQVPLDASSPASQVPLDASSPASQVPLDASSPASQVPLDASSPASQVPLDASSPASQVPLDAWLTWVDEVVASWAACLLSDQALAVEAAAAVAGSPHMPGPACEFRRLTAPDDRDRRAAVLVRHPDLVAPIADLHRTELHASLAAPARD